MWRRLGEGRDDSVRNFPLGLLSLRISGKRGPVGS